MNIKYVDLIVELTNDWNALDYEMLELHKEYILEHELSFDESLSLKFQDGKYFLSKDNKLISFTYDWLCTILIIRQFANQSI